MSGNKLYRMNIVEDDTKEKFLELGEQINIKTATPMSILGIYEYNALLRLPDGTDRPYIYNTERQYEMKEDTLGETQEVVSPDMFMTAIPLFGDKYLLSHERIYHFVFDVGALILDPRYDESFMIGLNARAHNYGFVFNSIVSVGKFVNPYTGAMKKVLKDGEVSMEFERDVNLLSVDVYVPVSVEIDNMQKMFNLLPLSFRYDQTT